MVFGASAHFTEEVNSFYPVLDFHHLQLLKPKMSKENQTIVNFLCYGCIIACFVSLLVVTSIFLDTKNMKEEILLAGACIGTTLVLSVIPFQLAPILSKYGSRQFQNLVRYGIMMCLGSQCFIAATVLRYAFLLDTPQLAVADFASWTGKQTLMFYLSNVFFIIAAIFTVIGFFKLFETLAVATLIDESNQDRCDPPTK